MNGKAGRLLVRLEPLIMRHKPVLAVRYLHLNSATRQTPVLTFHSSSFCPEYNTYRLARYTTHNN
jgi:hypothetical protein